MTLLKRKIHGLPAKVTYVCASIFLLYLGFKVYAILVMSPLVLVSDGQANRQIGHSWKDGVFYQLFSRMFFRRTNSNMGINITKNKTSSCSNFLSLDNRALMSIRKFAKLSQLSPFSMEMNFTLPDDLTNQKILVLTPVSNVEGMLEHYFRLLCSLTYDHSLLSIALGEDSSDDYTYAQALRLKELLQSDFRRIDVFRFNHKLKHEAPSHNTHAETYQKVRRAHLAESRNLLLLEAIQSDYDWVLWIDVDLKFFPPNLIEHLLSARKDILVPTVYYESNEDRKKVLRLYDRNTWRETKRSLEFLSLNSEKFLKLEGYTKTLRKFLPDLHQEGPVVRIDGVGGCILLVRADWHRKGLIFPNFVFKQHIETEGLAKMATEMNIEIYGMPNISVIHS